MNAPLRRTLTIIPAAALCMAALGGCASAVAERRTAASANSILPSSETAVFVTRVGDEITISWMSKPDQIYTLISKDRTRKDAEWTPVPDYENLPGTGQQMTVVLRAPGSDTRAFNVSAQPRNAPIRRAVR